MLDAYVLAGHQQQQRSHTVGDYSSKEGDQHAPRVAAGHECMPSQHPLS